MSDKLHNFMNTMWNDYIQINPQAQKIHTLLTHAGEVLTNDHIALRTFNHPKLGIQSLAQHFIKFGYKECGEYYFTEKKLYAKHYEHDDKSLPKIFISELELQKVSSYIQETISAVVEQIKPEVIAHENFV
ncbi:MAG: DUF1338 domain-containing protein, partial [Pseudobdellovibrio sp.]